MPNPFSDKICTYVISYMLNIHFASTLDRNTVKYVPTQPVSAHTAKICLLQERNLEFS